MTREQILRHIAEARRTMLQLAKLYPGCFRKNGKPIVAELMLPCARSAATSPKADGQMKKD